MMLQVDKTAAVALWVLALVSCCVRAEELTTVDPQARYPEGPLWRDGKLFYVEYAPGNIKQWDGKRTVVYWHAEGCGPSALIPEPPAGGLLRFQHAGGARRAR
jgi:sugar lactone lactonase YvrE